VGIFARLLFHGTLLYLRWHDSSFLKTLIFPALIHLFGGLILSGSQPDTIPHKQYPFQSETHIFFSFSIYALILFAWSVLLRGASSTNPYIF